MNAGLKWLCVCCAVLFTASGAAAHNRSQSFSTWNLTEGGGTVVLTASAREVTRLVESDEEYSALANALVRIASGQLGMRAGGAECTLSGPAQILNAREGFVAVEVNFTCPSSPDEIWFHGFFDKAPGHTNFAKLRGSLSTETLFTVKSTSFVWNDASDEPPSSAWSVARQYLWLGVTHIATGYDHLAFLLALMIFSLKPRSVLLIVTGFTLGHSITLSLAALQVVTPNGSTVEAVIGFTIALVAVENLTARGQMDRSVMWGILLTFGALLILRAVAGGGMGWAPLLGLGLFAFCYLALMDAPQKVTTWRPLVTATFGLVHGLGFASILLEQDLPTGNLVAALFSFNLGVELGQLVAVGVILVLALIARQLLQEKHQQLGRAALSAALVIIGLFWLGTRAIEVSI